MAHKPYRVIDRRSSYGYTQSNVLYDAANGNLQRKSVSGVDRDIHRVVTSHGRRQMMQFCRKAFANHPALSGMVLQQANLAVSNFMPQYYGRDRAWGDKAEQWLVEWHKIMDYRGGTFDFESWCHQLIVAALVDGDIGTVLVEGKDGYPFVQVIPSHRIYHPLGTSVLVGGDSKYKNAQVVDGVILNDYGQAVAYRVFRGDPSYASNDYDDIPADSFELTYQPQWSDQCRGIPLLAPAIEWLMDAQESRSYELIAQKAAASIGLMETNESGEADESKSLIRGMSSHTNGAKSGVDYETIEGGAIRYFRANSGCDLKAFSYDRPGASSQTFIENCMRDAFSAAEWDYWFSLQPNQTGGAMRIIVERINRTLRKRRKMVEKSARRIDGWAISKAIKLGLLPMNEDWWMWDYRGPQELSADRKYDSDVDIQEVNARFRTLKDVCGRRNEYWEEVQDQWLIEQKRFQDKAEEMGVDLTKIGSERAQEPKEEPAGNGDSETKPNRTPREANAEQ